MSEGGKDRRTQIVETAYELLGRGGLESLHARTVAAEVGVNHAAIHYYFPTRKDLLLAITDHISARFIQDRQAVLDRVAKKQAIEAEFALYEAYCRPQSRFFRVWASLFVAGQVQPEIKAKLAAFSRLMATSFAESLAASGKRNARTVLADPGVFCSTILGIGLRAQTMGDQDQAKHVFDQMVNSLR